MRNAMIGLVAAIWLMPLPAQAQSILKGGRAVCTSTLIPGAPANLEVENGFALSRRALVRDATVFHRTFMSDARAGTSEFPILYASLRGLIWKRPGEAETTSPKLFVSIGFSAQIGAKVGKLTVRYLWNGAVVHEGPGALTVSAPLDEGKPASVALRSELPRALLEDGRGTLEVLVLTTLGPEPLFRATFRLDGMGVTDWQRETAARADMDATGVRLNGKLPTLCFGRG